MLMGQKQSADHRLSVASFNICAHWYTDQDPTIQWESTRKSAVLQTILAKNIDIIATQELTTQEANDLNGLKGYASLFLIQHPCDLPAGSFTSKPSDWGHHKSISLMLGITFKDKFMMRDSGCFWLNENPYIIPIDKDNRDHDKGFGNKQTSRAVFWIKLFDTQYQKIIFVFNSHYPLSGTSETRWHCAQVERENIEKIAGDHPWFSMGDRNIIPQTEDLKQGLDILEPLLRNAYNARNAEKQLGPATTFAGFNADTNKNPINGSQFRNSVVLDVLVSNKPATTCEHLLIQIDPETKAVTLNPKIIDERRIFASDHLMVLATYKL